MPLTRPSSAPSLSLVRIGGLVLAAVPLVRLPSAFDPAQAPRALLVALVCAVVALAAGREGRMSRISLIASALGGAVLALMAASALVHRSPVSVFGVHGRFLGIVTAALVGVAAVTGYRTFSQDGRWFARFIWSSLAVQAALVIGQRLLGAVPVGTMQNTVLAGAWLAVASAVAVASARAEQGVARSLASGAAVLGVLALGLTGSRGAWIGCVAGIVFVVASSRSWRRQALAGAALAAVLAIGVLAAGPVVTAKLTMDDLRGGSAASRRLIWQSTARMVAAEPLLGVGPGRFLLAFPEFQSVEHARVELPDTRADQAHSVYLHVAAESGIPAAIAFIALVGLVLARASRSARAGDALALIAGAGFAAYAGQAVFGISTVETDTLAWILAGVVLARSDGAAAGEPHREATPVWLVASVRRLAPVTSLIVAASLAAATLLYVTADVRYQSGQDRYARADFTEALDRMTSASRLLPGEDIYRVGIADVCLARLAARMPDADAAGTLGVLDDGLRREPADFDLALAKARVMRSSGSDARTVTDAYRRALALYPMGLTVRCEAIEAALTAGDRSLAERLGADLLSRHPNDPRTIATLSKVRRG